MAASETLMRKVQQGDTDAFEELMSRHAAAVADQVTVHVAQTNLTADIPVELDGDDVDHLVQEVFLQVLRARREYDESVAFEPWLLELADQTAAGFVDKCRLHRPPLRIRGERLSSVG